jgi:hypothetical protein
MRAMTMNSREETKFSSMTERTKRMMMPTMEAARTASQMTVEYQCYVSFFSLSLTLPKIS